MQGKDDSFRLLEAHPPNGGVSAALLIEQPITPIERLFVRSHGETPYIDADVWRLSVTGAVKHPLTLRLNDLQRFPRKTITAALACAGNRRVEMAQIAPIPGELIWDREAVGCVEWSGYSLAAVLREAGVDSDYTEGLHVAFEAADQVVPAEGQPFAYGASIPLAAALDPWVLLADTINGAPLPPDHGGPLRVFAPGTIGARSVKWVTRIVVQHRPSDNYYQQRAYKLFPPNVQPDSANWDEALMLGGLPINAAIVTPEDRAIVPPGKVPFKGYALSGGQGVARLDLSVDNGSTWVQAALHGDDLPYAWRLWSVELELGEGDYQVIARAWDHAANTQPEQIIWNFKGYMNNACPRIRLQVKGK
ncbi:MAG: molybdopterin-dependent oxidoreductase [Anaerolineae bacterium]